MRADVPPLHHQLRQQSGRLRELFDKAEQIGSLDRVVHEWLREPWLESVRVANVRGETLVLFVSTGAALVPLRYRGPSLLEYLQRRLGTGFTKLEAKVKPARAKR